MAEGRDGDVAPCEARLDRLIAEVRQARHDVNNQLGIVIGYAELLQEDPAIPVPVREILAEMEACAAEAVAAVERIGRDDRRRSRLNGRCHQTPA